MLRGAEVVREGERQPEHAGDLGAVAARAEQPELGHVAEPGHGGDRAVRVALGKARRKKPTQLAELAAGSPRRRAASTERRSAAAVTWSVPGARPIPRSMRPGCSASSVPNCSATTSGAWLGSITPPEPTRIVSVCAARWPRARPAPSSRSRACCGARRPSGGGSRALDALGELDRVAQGVAGARAVGDEREVEDGERGRRV